MSKKKVAKKVQAKKKVTASKPSVKEGNLMCLRQVDKNTVVMSDDPSLPPHKVTPEKLAKGFTRVDSSTVVKTGA